MKKILLFSLIFLLLTSCSNTWDSKNNISNWNKKETFEDLLWKINSTYKKDAKFDSCMSKNIKSCLNNIVNEKAQEKNDYKLCEDLSDKDVVDACKEAVILNKAKKEENYKLCDVLSKNVDMCYYQVLSYFATEKLDTKYCDLLSEIKDTIKSWTWGQAIPQFPNNVKICKDSVIMQTAMKNKDSLQCNKLEEKPMQENCKNMVNPTNMMPPIPPIPLTPKPLTNN